MAFSPLVLALAACTAAVDPSEVAPALRADFERNYPKDAHPASTEKHLLGFPYPRVQPGDTYDADFVKDDGGDGGHWAAKEAYDHLRHLLVEEQGKLDDAKANLGDEQEAYKKALLHKRKSEEAAQQAAEELARAHKAVEDAEAAEAAANAGKQVVATTPKPVPVVMDDGGVPEADAAAAAAEKEQEDVAAKLARCKDELAKAEAEYKKRVADEEEHARNFKDLEGSAAGESGKADQAKSGEANALQKLKAVSEKHYLQVKEYEREVQLAGQMKTRLGDLAARLRRFRGEEVNTTQAPEKSGAGAGTPVWLALASLALSCLRH